MPGSAAPVELSVVVVVGACRSRGQRTLDALGAQTAREKMEVVVVDIRPDLPSLTLPSGARTQMATSPRADGMGPARAIGLRRATGTSVAFIEEHCYAEPGWAEALIRAHGGPWAAVGYAFKNANPESYVSRAGLVAGYGPWIAPARRGVTAVLPGNNVSYKREFLLSLGDKLDDAMEADYVAHGIIRQRGLQMYLEPDAVVAHLNYDTVWNNGLNHFHWGRVMADRRASALGWGRGRRLAWGVLSPVGDLAFRWGRLLAGIRSRPAITGEVLTALPVVTLVGLFASTGQALGYLIGAGRSQEFLTRLEADVERDG